MRERDPRKRGRDPTKRGRDATKRGRLPAMHECLPLTVVSPSRRRLLGLAGASTLLAGCQPLLGRPERGPILGLFSGPSNAPGIASMGLAGLHAIRDQLRIPVRIAENAGIDQAGLRKAAATDATMVIVFDERASEAVQRVAWEFPEQRFTCIHGDKLRPNVAIYDARGEQSAWLAGAASALLSKSGIIGHVSGAMRPSLARVRAGFVDGARSERPDVRVLTRFTLADADPERAFDAVRAMVAAGADVLFVTPETDPREALQHARLRGVTLIGQGPNWLEDAPALFTGAAVADITALTLALGRDFQDAIWRGDEARRYVVRQPHVVRFALSPDAPRDVRSRLDELRGRMAAGQIRVAERYDGPEFIA